MEVLNVFLVGIASQFTTKRFNIPMPPGVVAAVHSVTFNTNRALAYAFVGISKELTTDSRSLNSFLEWKDVWVLTRAFVTQTIYFDPPYRVVGPQLLCIREDSGTNHTVGVRINYTREKVSDTVWADTRGKRSNA